MDHISNKIGRMKKHAKLIFTKGLQAVEPGNAVKKKCKFEKNCFFTGKKSFDLSMYKNIFVAGMGKAAAPMASALEDLLGDRITHGIINVKYGHVEKLKKIKINEAGHPVPDICGEHGALQILDLVKSAKKEDLVIFLISGGGSALLPIPAQNLTLKDKQATIKILLSCGASIHEINAIRKHISSVKGGRLAQAAYPADIVSLILSDVVGDDLDVIASGPTVPDLSTFSVCMEIIDRYNIAESLPEPILRHIKKGVSGKLGETPKPGDPVFDKTFNLITGSNIDAINAAGKEAEALGYNKIILSSMIEGNTTESAHFHAAIAREILKTGNPVPPPACILSGGETTVKIMGKGKGGRNQEFSLAAAFDIAGQKNIVVLSAGTDGTDGPTDAAGAIADTYTLKRAKDIGLLPQSFLADNDSYHFFEKLNDLLITGPTRTNVMDLRVVIVE